MNKLTISQVAKQGGVNLQTIRYYERQGLLAPISRTEAGYRIYQKDTVRRLRFIKRAQELGFSLSEIKDLLYLRLDAHTTSADIRVRAQAKLADVEQKIRHLEAIQKSLSRLIKSCRGCGPAADCPILENLDGEDFP
ncbi:MAG: heavy metal-responsive transcriptional regulator [Acidobacteriota bacterium]|jgi:Cu(I)-responsive transcriptional regulator